MLRARRKRIPLHLERGRPILILWADREQCEVEVEGGRWECDGDACYCVKYDPYDDPEDHDWEDWGHEETAEETPF